MQNNYGETVPSICCPECGHLFLDSSDICPFCEGLPVYHRRDIKSPNHIDKHIMFDDEKYLFEMAFDDGP
jgi:hypothetical protein